MDSTTKAPERAPAVADASNPDLDIPRFLDKSGNAPTMQGAIGKSAPTSNIKQLPAPKSAKASDAKPGKVDPPKGAAPSTEDAPATTIAPRSYVQVPALYLAAASQCAGKDATRFYLSGVYLHAVDGALRIVASDGARMLILSSGNGEDAPLPTWTKAGIIIPLEGLKARLALIGTAEMNHVRIGFSEGDPRIELSDLGGTSRFIVNAIDGAFPDYQKMVAGSVGAFASADRRDFQATSFDPTMVKGVAEIAKALDSPMVNVFSGEADQATVVTFRNVPQAVLYMMPKQTGGAAELPTATRAILAPALKGTVAALRANMTRTKEAAKTLKGAELASAEAKIASYDRRIADAMAMAATGLPKPEAKTEEKPAPKATAARADKTAKNGATVTVLPPRKLRH